MDRPPIEGVIDRRLLVNYRVDPDIAGTLLPSPFRPQLVNGYAVAGICLLRMTEHRPHPLPRWVGLRSENAAHRIAVEWDDETGIRSGVYIPRRDSASMGNVIVGGRIYPGVHHRAHFEVRESDQSVAVRLASKDRSTKVDVEVEISDSLPKSRLFADVEEASQFFQRGSVGYSQRAIQHASMGWSYALPRGQWLRSPSCTRAPASSRMKHGCRKAPPHSIARC